MTHARADGSTECLLDDLDWQMHRLFCSDRGDQWEQQIRVCDPIFYIPPVSHPLLSHFGELAKMPFPRSSKGTEIQMGGTSIVISNAPNLSDCYLLSLNVTSGPVR